MQRRIAGIEVVLGSMPGRQVDISGSRRQQYEAVAVELWQSLALGLCVGDFLIRALEETSSPELAEFESLDGIQHRAVDLGPQLTCGMRRVFWRERDVVEIGSAALGFV